MGDEESRTAAMVRDVVESIEGVIRRHGVTPAEFREAVAFVRGLVEGGELELLTAVLFEAVVDEVAEVAHEGTDSNVEGPFHVPDAPLIGAPGTATLPMRPDEAGDPLTFAGRVCSTDGHPLASAVLDIWQADDEGLYSQFAPGVPEWNLRGRMRTDDEGRFAFRSVVPSAYDIPEMPRTARLLEVLGMGVHRPAHVHLKVTADGHRDLTTQAYFTGDPWLDQDVTGAAKPSLVVDLRDAAGPGRACTFDIVLAPA